MFDLVPVSGGAVKMRRRVTPPPFEIEWGIEHVVRLSVNVSAFISIFYCKSIVIHISFVKFCVANAAKEMLMMLERNTNDFSSLSFCPLQ